MASKPPDGATWDPDVARSLDPRSTWDPAGTPPSTPSTPASVDDGGDRYDEGPVVGQGGLADVRSARDRRLGRDVAVKRLRDPQRGQSRARFLQEARVAAQLEHPGIVPVHDVDVDADGAPFYTMRFVRGEPMSEALARARTLEQRLALLPDLLSVCQAMAYAHEQGILHRDLKPQNVMLGPFGEAVVVDWGLARVLEAPDGVEGEEEGSPPGRSSPVSTQVGAVHGTPAYMAPEQARGEEVGPAADVYGLGAMLYEVLTGLPPRSGSETAEEQLMLARTGRHVPVAELQPDCPRDLAAIAERALAAEASGRYPTAAGMAHDLEQWTQGRFVQAHHYTAMERLLNLYRRYRVPVLLVLLGLVATSIVATVGALRTAAERDRAMVAAADARRLSATLLVARADRAWRDGDTVAARAFAVSALALEESPLARGVLLAAWGAPDVRALPDIPTPGGCRDVLAAPNGGDILCLGDGELSRVAGDGTVRWRQVVEVDPNRKGLSMAAAPGASMVWVAGRSSVAGVDAANGAVLVEYPSRMPRGLVATKEGPWWLEAGGRVRGPHGFQKTIRGAFVASVVVSQRPAPPPLLLRGAGRLETLDGELVYDVFRVNYGAVRMLDGSVWFLGARSLVLPPDGGTPRLLDVGRVSLFAGRQRDGLTALGATDGSVYVTDGTDPDALVRLPPTRRGPPRFDVRRLDDHAELLVAAEGRIRRWRLDRTGPPVQLLDEVWRRQTVADDGQSWLWCGLDGRFLWFDRGEATPGRVDTEGGPELCSIVDDTPYVSWGPSATFRLRPEGPEPVTLRGGVRALHGHQGRLLVETHDALWFDDQVLGEALVGVDGDSLVVLDFDGERPTRRHTWRWQGDRYARDTTEELPKGALTLLDDGAIVRVDGVDLVIEQADRLRFRLEGHRERPVRVVPLPDGRLASGGADGRVLVWDLADGALLADLDLGGGRVGALDFLPGPQWLSVETFDGAVHTLRLDGVFAPAAAMEQALRARMGMTVEGGVLVLTDAP